MSARVWHVYLPAPRPALAGLASNLREALCVPQADSGPGSEAFSFDGGTVTVTEHTEQALLEAAARLAPDAPAPWQSTLERCPRLLHVVPSEGAEAHAERVWTLLCHTPGAVGFDPEARSFFAPSPTREALVVYRLEELDPRLCAALPVNAAPRRCLFYIAHLGSRATARLFAELPEPPMEHLTEGMAVASLVPRAASRSPRLAAHLRPAEFAERPLLAGWYSMGFHTGDAGEVERWLRAQGHALVPAREVLEDVCVFAPRRSDGEAPYSLFLRRLVGGRLRLDALFALGGGLFAVGLGDARGELRALYADGEVALLEGEPAAGVREVQLEAPAKDSGPARPPRQSAQRSLPVGPNGPLAELEAPQREALCRELAEWVRFALRPAISRGHVPSYEFALGELEAALGAEDFARVVEQTARR